MISLEEAKKLGEGYKVVPVSREILSDIRTPIEVLRILKGVSRHCYMLESVEHQERWGRYTFLGTVKGVHKSEGSGSSDLYRRSGWIFLL